MPLVCWRPWGGFTYIHIYGVEFDELDKFNKFPEIPRSANLFTPKSRGNAAQFSAELEWLGMRSLAACVVSGSFTRLTTKRRGECCTNPTGLGIGRDAYQVYPFSNLSSLSKSPPGGAGGGIRTNSAKSGNSRNSGNLSTLSNLSNLSNSSKSLGGSPPWGGRQIPQIRRIRGRQFRLGKHPTHITCREAENSSPF